MDEIVDGWRPEVLNAGGPKLPEVPADPMEFLSRSWTVSLLEVSKALAPLLPPGIGTAAVTIPESAEEAEDPAAVFGNPFSFASAATAQLVMERILSQSQEASPRTSGRLSHSSGPLAGGQSGGSLTDSPPVSPCNMDDTKYHRGAGTVAAATKPQPPRGRSVGRWLKDRRERKKEEARAHNAQLHAAVSVAGVAAAVAAVAAATAAASSSRTDVAVASAATLVAAQCVEAAEALGAERDHLAAVVASAVSVRTPGDVVTLTAAAATALRGAATLKARALKEVWNAAAIIPVEKNSAASGGDNHDCRRLQPDTDKGVAAAAAAELLPDVNHQLLARGSELLKRTRKGALHWKHVSVYINRMGQVLLKMTSRHVAGTITKKKKGVITEVCKEIAAWPGRRLLESGDLRWYFGLRMADRRVIEFECRGQREYDIWTRGVSGLLTAARERTRIP